MNRDERKAAKLAYRLALPPMGVFVIRNCVDGRVWMDRSRNLTGSVNRHRMELRRGVHRHRALMADWRRHGEAGFAFEVVARVEASDEPGFDPDAALDRLWVHWHATLPDGSPGSYR